MSAHLTKSPVHQRASCCACWTTVLELSSVPQGLCDMLSPFLSCLEDTHHILVDSCTRTKGRVSVLPHLLCCICRYVWLPLWVLPNQNTPQRARGAALGGGNGAMLSGSDAQGRHPGGNVMPADVVVRWHDLWRFSDFDRVPKSRWEGGRLYHM